MEKALIRLLPSGSDANFSVTLLTETKVERAVKPESIALGVFGAIAALAGSVIAAIAISRKLRSADEELQVLRAVGASPTTTVADTLVGVLVATLAGSLLTIAIAVYCRRCLRSDRFDRSTTRQGSRSTGQSWALERSC